MLFAPILLIITGRDISLGTQETRQMRELSVKVEKVRLCDDKLASQLTNNAHRSACVQKLSVAADGEEAAVTDGDEEKLLEENNLLKQDCDENDAGHHGLASQLAYNAHRSAYLLRTTHSKLSLNIVCCNIYF